MILIRLLERLSVLIWLLASIGRGISYMQLCSRFRNLSWLLGCKPGTCRSWLRAACKTEILGQLPKYSSRSWLMFTLSFLSLGRKLPSKQESSFSDTSNSSRRRMCIPRISVMRLRRRKSFTICYMWTLLKEFSWLSSRCTTTKFSKRGKDICTFWKALLLSSSSYRLSKCSRVPITFILLLESSRYLRLAHERVKTGKLVIQLWLRFRNLRRWWLSKLLAALMELQERSIQRTFMGVASSSSMFVRLL